MAMAASAAVWLARWLSVADFGVFEQISFFVMGIAGLILGDLGLTVALVRLEQEPLVEHWQGAWCISVLLASGALAVGAGAAGWLAVEGHRRLALLVVVLAVALSARMTRAVPSARLQRDRRFATLAMGELLEATLYFVLALGLAAMGRGIVALVSGVAVKEVGGAAWLWARSPSRPRLVMRSLAKAGPLLAVGLPAQGAGLLVGLTDAFQPLFIGPVLGAVALGFVTWAYGLALLPLLILSALDRVLLPALSRAQSDAETLRRWIERAIRANAWVALPTCGFLLLRGNSLVRLVFGPKWLPALPLVHAFLPGIAITALSTPLLHGFNAVGKTRVALYLAAAWLGLTWTIGAIATERLGTSGFAGFYIGLQVTFLPVWWCAGRGFGIAPWRAVRGVVIGVGLVTVLGLALPSPQSLAWLVADGAAFLLACVAAVHVVDRTQSRQDRAMLLVAVRDVFRPGERPTRSPSELEGSVP